jgi:hypothetical protein
VVVTLACPDEDSPSSPSHQVSQISVVLEGRIGRPAARYLNVKDDYLQGLIQRKPLALVKSQRLIPAA